MLSERDMLSEWDMPFKLDMLSEWDMLSERDMRLLPLLSEPGPVIVQLVSDRVSKAPARTMVFMANLHKQNCPET
jgi:hypothetical protein